MGHYAEGTSVPVSRSREELQRILERAGALEIAFATGAGGRARCAFRLKSTGLLVALEVPPVDPAALARKLGIRSDRYSKKEGRWLKPHELALAKADGEHRRRWRALLLVVKAKLEAIASGISTFEGEFMAGVVLANGRTLEAELAPKLKELAESGAVPSLLPSGEQQNGGT